MTTTVTELLNCKISWVNCEKRCTLADNV